MLIGSIVVVIELWLTRSRIPHKCGSTRHPAYRCFRRTPDSVMQGAGPFFAAAPLALVLEYYSKGPHFFPPSDQGVAIWLASLSIMMTFWAWRVNRCLAAIDLVKGGSPVNGARSQLPLVCFFIAIPFAGILQYIRHNTAQVVTTDADAFNFNNFALLICQGIEFHLELFRQVNTPGQANTSGLSSQPTLRSPPWPGRVFVSCGMISVFGQPF